MECRQCALVAGPAGRLLPGLPDGQRRHRCAGTRPRPGDHNFPPRRGRRRRADDNDHPGGRRRWRVERGRTPELRGTNRRRGPPQAPRGGVRHRRPRRRRGSPLAASLPLLPGRRREPRRTRRRAPDEPALEVVEASLSRSSAARTRRSSAAARAQAPLETVAAHPHVKKVIPGPIDAGGSGSRTGVRAKATRADKHGNVRLLIRDGSVQENRIVTTAGDRELGERVRADINDALRRLTCRSECLPARSTAIGWE